jgi:lysozyme
VAAVVVPFVGGFEGLRQTAYPDPASHGYPWTICYGHTDGVKRGDHDSIGECKQLLLSDLEKEGAGIDRCITYPTTDGQAVAFLSLAHNIGTGGFCRSSVARDFNAGRTKQACNDLLKFDRAAGIVFPGLQRRRQAERRLCLGQAED